MDSTRFTTANSFAPDPQRQRLTQIELLIAEMRLSIRNLDTDIKAEEQRTRISDPGHIAYSTLAMAAIQRRDNLKRTIARLEDQQAAMRLAADAQAPDRAADADGTSGGSGAEFAA